MIKSVYVDGLESLRGVKIDLQPGLNVLVGPNESGKSNILAAFKLISNLSHLEKLNTKEKDGLTEIQELFNSHNEEKRITIEIEGEIEKQDMKKNLKKCKSLSYKYRGSIEVDAKHKNKLYFSRQSLKFNIIQNDNKETKVFDVTYSNNKIFINKCDTFFKKCIADSMYAGSYRELHFVDNYLEMLFVENPERLRYGFLIRNVCYFFEQFKNVLMYIDFVSDYDFNPDSIRHHIYLDATRFNKPGKMFVEIQENGRGLLTSLLCICHFCKGKPDTSRYINNRGINYQNAYNIILSYLKHMSPQIVDWSVEYDEVDQKITGSISLEEKDGKISIQPLEVMSDIKLKGLTLITALLVNNYRKLAVIRELESSFHPSTQHFIIDLMRKTLKKDSEVRLFSINSETIMNKLNPNEVILTSYQDGQTLAYRKEEKDLIKKTTEESGVGIG